MKLVRPALVASAAIVSVLGLSASAAPSTAPRTLVVTDTAGDANGLNDQGFGAGPAGTATPGSQAALDIVKATLADYGTTKVVKKKKVFTCQGFTLSIKMAGAVGKTPAIYRLLGSTTANDGIFQLYWNNGASGAKTEVRYGAGDADDTAALSTPAKIVNDTIIITVTKADMALFGDKPGNEISDFVVQDSISSGATFLPQVDQAVSPASFVMC
jgi:hypothetical protein